jgi:hypothetical protein
MQVQELMPGGPFELIFTSTIWIISLYTMQMSDREPTADDSYKSNCTIQKLRNMTLSISEIATQETSYLL